MNVSATCNRAAYSASFADLKAQFDKPKGNSTSVDSAIPKVSEEFLNKVDQGAQDVDSTYRVSEGFLYRPDHSGQDVDSTYRVSEGLLVPSKGTTDSEVSRLSLKNDQAQNKIDDRSQQLDRKNSGYHAQKTDDRDVIWSSRRGAAADFITNQKSVIDVRPKTPPYCAELVPTPNNLAADTTDGAKSMVKSFQYGFARNASIDSLISLIG